MPGATPVTKPVPLTVATDGVAETHGFEAAGVPEPVNCVVFAPAEQIVKLPVIVGVGLITKFAAVRQPGCTEVHSA